MPSSANALDLFIADVVRRLDEIGVKPDHKKSIHAEVTAKLRERHAGRHFFEGIILEFNRRRPSTALDIGVREPKSTMRELLVGLPDEHPFFRMIAMELSKHQASKRVAKASR